MVFQMPISFSLVHGYGLSELHCAVQLLFLQKAAGPVIALCWGLLADKACDTKAYSDMPPCITCSCFVLAY